MAKLFEYNNTGDNNNWFVYSVQWGGQTFTPTTAHKITSVKLKLYRKGSPGTITVGIRATDGSGLPTGADLVSGTTDGDTLTTDTDGEWREITLGSGYNLSANTRYAIVSRVSAGDVNNILYWRFRTGGYTNGAMVNSATSGVSWEAYTNYDFMFEDWGTNAQYIISTSTSLGLSPAVSRSIAVSRTSAPTMSLEIGVTLSANQSYFLCVASRDSGSIKTSNSLGTTWSDCAKDAGGGLKGSYFAQYLNRLCVINNVNTGFAYSSVNDIVANWTSKPDFPNLLQKFTGMFVSRDASDDPAIYFLTPIGMYYLDVFTNFVFGPTEVQWEYDSTSGKKGIYHKGTQYIAVGKSIYKIYKGDVDPTFGPDKDDGLPEDMQGTVTDIIGVGPWIVIAVDGGTLNKSSILKKYATGNHWHTVYVGSANTPIRTLFWDSGTLYLGEGTNVKSLPLPNTTDNVAKLSTYTYSASGDLIYTYYHSQFEAMTKVAHKLRAVTQDCNSNEKITIYYRKDEETTWTLLGSFASSPRPTALPFPASGSAVGVEFERIQPKASFARGDTTTNSPKLESLILEYRVTPPVLWGWTIRVRATTEGDHRGQDIIDALKTAIETGTLLSFYPSGDKSKTQYLVQVTGMPGNEAGTEFGTEGIYQVTLSEVIE